MNALRLAVLGGLCGVATCAAEAALPEEVRFNRDIRPILSENCFACHGFDANARKAGLRLDVRDGVLAARRGGAAIIPGDPQSSEAFRRITSTDPDEVMPPPESHKTLTADQIALIERWIGQGAEYEPHWAYIAPQRSVLPGAGDAEADEARNPIDRFILDRLRGEGIEPSPRASKETLIRRVTLDLTGLPPTPREVEDFLADTAPGAYERLVDRLLESPRFGERMAWDWLDAARYADSNGYQGDGERTMWPWRDWVVDAINRNMPYDQFTLWQVAGDLLPEATFEQRLATGFNRNHMINGEGGRIPEENRVEYVFDKIETVGTVWLGLTLQCARCHDHKYDPISQRDYFSLFAFFNQMPVDGSGGNPQTPPVVEAPSEEQQAERARLNTEVRAAAAAVQEHEQSLFPRPEGQPSAASEDAAGLPDELKAALQAVPARRNPNQLAELEKHFASSQSEYAQFLKRLRESVAQREATNLAIPKVMVMADMPEPRKTFILNVGLYNQPRDEVAAATPAALPPMPEGAPMNRLGLAQWLIAPENPLTARVTVNRFWQMFFGAGLVRTPEDFGFQGELPTHPELLDWLALEFIDSGWDVKNLVRLIVTSATYRQDSRVTPHLLERDPDNRLLARGPRFRMPSWMLRDQALAASGLMVGDLGGQPVHPYQPEGIWEEATFGLKKYVQDHGPALYRRSLYTFWRRIAAPTMLFDGGTRQVCSVTQIRTNTPMHALITLNDISYVEAARAMAQRVLNTNVASDADRIDSAFRRILARAPQAAERTVLLSGLKRLRSEFSADPSAAGALLEVGESTRDPALDPVEHAAWLGVCMTILNLDEALTKE